MGSHRLRGELELKHVACLSAMEWQRQFSIRDFQPNLQSQPKWVVFNSAFGFSSKKKMVECIWKKLQICTCNTDILITHLCIQISSLMHQDLIRKHSWTCLHCNVIKNLWDIRYGADGAHFWQSEWKSPWWGTSSHPTELLPTSKECWMPSDNKGLTPSWLKSREILRAWML